MTQDDSLVEGLNRANSMRAGNVNVSPITETAKLQTVNQVNLNSSVDEVSSDNGEQVDPLKVEAYQQY